jgi:hypothetical protein
MRHYIRIFAGTLSLFLLMGCNGESTKNKNLYQKGINKNLKANKSNSNLNNVKNTLSVNDNLPKDTIADLLSQLMNVPAGDNYIVKGELKTEILKFKSVNFGDMIHFIFIDNKNKEYDFNGNITKVELDKDASNPDDEDGYEANRKYVNKRFRVVWRTLKLKNKPKTEMEMYYEEFDEIIYLKQVN